MNIYNVNGNKYIDQDLYDYIAKIWLNYDDKLLPDSNIYFAPNTTINRLITDYSGNNISRVIKKAKADYVVIDKFTVNNYPQFYDGTNITNDDTKEVVYGIYNLSSENILTVELINDFITNKQEVKFINQARLNESINNGFVLDDSNYTTIKELVDSQHTDNHILAVNMLINSDLEKNWEWIIYLFFKKKDRLFNHDKKYIISSYIKSLGLPYAASDLFLEFDYAIKTCKDQKVKDKFVQRMRQDFNENINTYFDTLGTSKFILRDFKIDYQE